MSRHFAQTPRKRSEIFDLWPRTPVVPFALLYSAVTFGILTAVNVRGLPTDFRDHMMSIATSHATGDWIENWLMFRTISVLSTRSNDIHVLSIVGVAVLSMMAFIKVFVSSQILSAETGIAELAPGERRAATGIVAASVLLLQFAFSLPRGIHNFYIGQFPANVWHNPTTMALMPFALMLWWQGVHYVRRPRLTTLAWIVLLGVVNVLVKPSFFMSFAIVLTLASMIAHRVRKPFWELVAALAAPAILMLAQAGTLFGASDSEFSTTSVVVAPFHVWGHYSNSFTHSLAVSLAFPLAVFVRFSRASIANLSTRLAWANFVVALAIFVTLSETGVREFHGNFSWQMIVATYILFLTSLAVAISQWFHRGDRGLSALDWVIVGVFAAHVGSGAFYLCRWFTFGVYS